MISVVFTSCKKEEDTITKYDISGVWETVYANLDGDDMLTEYSHVYEFFWDDGTYGSEGYDLNGNLDVFSIGTYSLSADQTSLTYNIEYIDDDGDDDFTNGTYTSIILLFDVTKFDNSNLHINTWNILVDGASVLYNKRLEKTNITLPPL